MTDPSRQAREAERRLLELGLEVAVAAAGDAGELAVIRADGEATAALFDGLRRAAVEACNAAGFRYVTLELASVAGRRDGRGRNARFRGD